MVHPGEPGRCKRCSERVRLGEVCGGGRKVAVGLAIAEQAADDRYGVLVPDLVAGQHDPVLGGGDLEQADSSSRSNHPTHLAQRALEVREVPEGVPADQPIDRTVGQGECRGIRLDQRPGAMGGIKHPEGQVGADGEQSRLGCRPTQVAGPTGEIEDPRPRGESEGADGPTTPTGVEPERHDPIDQLVARSDVVEHRPHHAGLVLLGRKD